MDYPNVRGYLGAITTAGQATLNELKTIYSIQDALMMFEIVMVNRYNEYLALKHAEKEAKKGRQQ